MRKTHPMAIRERFIYYCNRSFFYIQLETLLCTFKSPINASKKLTFRQRMKLKKTWYKYASHVCHKKNSKEATTKKSWEKMRIAIVLVLSLAAIAFGQAPGVYVNQAGCGSRPLKPDGRIQGGNNTLIGDHPHQVLVLVQGRYTCGGSIFHHSGALCAAHCISTTVYVW